MYPSSGFLFTFCFQLLFSALCVFIRSPCRYNCRVAFLLCGWLRTAYALKAGSADFFFLSLILSWVGLCVGQVMSCLPLQLVPFCHYCHFFVPVWTKNAGFVTPPYLSSEPYFPVVHYSISLPHVDLLHCDFSTGKHSAWCFSFSGNTIKSLSGSFSQCVHVVWGMRAEALWKQKTKCHLLPHSTLFTFLKALKCVRVHARTHVFPVPINK